MRIAGRISLTARTMGIAAVAASLALAALPSAATAGGRLIETGHDADWRCAVGGTQCHFIQVAVRYVRNGAPDPSKKLLVIDDAGLQMRQALINAFGPGIVSQMDVVDPKGPQWQNAPLTPSVYSAIVMASDQTCGNDAAGFFHGDTTQASSYCDLNRPPNNLDPDGTAWPPPPVGLPGSLSDSPRIAARSAAIKSFFDAGGGLYVGSGADNGDGHTGDLYYSFIDLPGGAAGSACDPAGGICLGSIGGLALTPEGRAIGFVDSGPDNDITCGLNGMSCSTHNSFKAPRVGSSLLVAESGPTNFESTLFEDANPPNTTVTGGPGAPLTVAPPAPPIPVVASPSATFTFAASEDTTTFACSLDGGAASSCSPPVSFSGLAAGVHKLVITATDAAHNQDATPAEASWLVAFDNDHDGYLKSNPFGVADCNDSNGAIHPNAREIRGNRVDENCDQVIAPFRRLRPGLSFHFVGASCAHCIRFTRLAVTGVPAVATVRIQCTGKRCHFAKIAAKAHHHKATVRLLRYVRRLHLPPGNTVQVSVTAPKTIGAIERLPVRLRKGVPDVRQVKLCRSPKARRPARHCASIR